MTEEKETKDRIPFESIDAATPISAWHLPDIASSTTVTGKKRKPKPRGVKEAIEEVAEEDKPSNLTAEDLRQITEEARKEGFQQGLHEGTEQGIREGTKVGQKTGEQRAYAEAKTDIEALQNQLRQISSRLFDPMQQQELEIENIIVDLSLNLAKHLIHQEVQAEPQILLNVINKVLATMPRGASCLQVYLNDKDALLVENLHLAAPREWSIKRDNSLASGGCRIESEHSLVDYSIEERLAHYLEKVADIDAPVDDASIPPLENYAVMGAQREAQREAPFKQATATEPVDSESKSLDENKPASSESLTMPTEVDAGSPSKATEDNNNDPLQSPTDASLSPVTVPETDPPLDGGQKGEND